MYIDIYIDIYRYIHIYDIYMYTYVIYICIYIYLYVYIFSIVFALGTARGSSQHLYLSEFLSLLVCPPLSRGYFLPSPHTFIFSQTVLVNLESLNPVFFPPCSLLSRRHLIYYFEQNPMILLIPLSLETYKYIY